MHREDNIIVISPVTSATSHWIQLGYVTDEINNQRAAPANAFCAKLHSL